MAGAVVLLFAFFLHPLFFVVSSPYLQVLCRGLLFVRHAAVTTLNRSFFFFALFNPFYDVCGFEWQCALPDNIKVVRSKALEPSRVDRAPRILSIKQQDLQLRPGVFTKLGTG